ncbi:hypothetical protein BJX62DRAFT_208833 [Aspergillus germanicus]
MVFFSIVRAPGSSPQRTIICDDSFPTRIFSFSCGICLGTLATFWWTLLDLFVEVYPRPGLSLYLRIKAWEHSELWLLLEFRWEMDTIVSPTVATTTILSNLELQKKAY